MKNSLTRQEREKLDIESSILRQAEELFSKNGYENTTMGDLSESCEYTKRTIYRHFTCKEDLYFAVLLKGHTSLLEAIKEKIQEKGPGLEKIKSAYRVFFNFYLESGMLFDLMTQIKAIKSNRNPNDLPFYQKYSECLRIIYTEIISLFQTAYDDKSIRTDVEAEQLAFSTAFLLNGFFHMLSLSGDSFVEHFSLNKDSFIDLTMKILFQLLEGEKCENYS